MQWIPVPFPDLLLFREHGHHSMILGSQHGSGRSATAATSAPHACLFRCHRAGRFSASDGSWSGSSICQSAAYGTHIFLRPVYADVCRWWENFIHHLLPQFPLLWFLPNLLLYNPRAWCHYLLEQELLQHNKLAGECLLALIRLVGSVHQGQGLLWCLRNVLDEAMFNIVPSGPPQQAANFKEIRPEEHLAHLLLARWTNPYSVNMANNRAALITGQ